jgi:hypothetical protein
MRTIPTGDGTRRFDDADSRVTRFGQYFFTADLTACVFVPWSSPRRPEMVTIDLARKDHGQARYDALLAHHKTLLAKGELADRPGVLTP